MIPKSPDSIKTIRLFPGVLKFSGCFQYCGDISRWYQTFAQSLSEKFLGIERSYPESFGFFASGTLLTKQQFSYFRCSIIKDYDFFLQKVQFLIWKKEKQFNCYLGKSTLVLLSSAIMNEAVLLWKDGNSELLPCPS